MLPSTVSFAQNAPQGWWQVAEVKEPELREICLSGLRTTPFIEQFDGWTRADYVRVRATAREKMRASLDAKSVRLIVAKLTAAYAAQPRDWHVVGQAIDAAQYARPQPEILVIAEEIVRTVPPVKFGGQLAAVAMMLLSLSSEKRYTDIVFDSLNNGDFRKVEKGNAPWLVDGALESLSQLPTAEAKQYFERLAVTYPYIPKEEEGNSGYYGPPGYGIPKLVQNRLREIEEIKYGGVIEITAYP